MVYCYIIRFINVKHQMSRAVFFYSTRMAKRQNLFFPVVYCAVMDGHDQQ